MSVGLHSTGHSRRESGLHSLLDILGESISYVFSWHNSLPCSCRTEVQFVCLFFCCQFNAIPNFYRPPHSLICGPIPPISKPIGVGWSPLTIWISPASYFHCIFVCFPLLFLRTHVITLGLPVSSSLISQF